MAQKILIVDDAHDVVELMEFNLRDKGYEVITAHNGVDGLEKAKSEKPDLIVLDIMMPKMDGYSFIQEIKKIDGGANIPIIVVSVKDKMQDIFKMEGAKEYFIKPFSPETLLASIRKYLH